MSSLPLRLYHRLPAPARSAAATLGGFYLRAWRYGGDFERLVEGALARERWTRQQWSAWRDERLGALLERAATRVPFYREAWQARRRAGECAIIQTPLAAPAPRGIAALERWGSRWRPTSTV